MNKQDIQVAELFGVVEASIAKVKCFNYSENKGEFKQGIISLQFLKIVFIKK